ncbi:MAG: CHAT domain-containing protein [Saprospiraceae bacterium]|nr:CHAT domain-containing protein [Saprospiraceae bacterium]
MHALTNDADPLYSQLVFTQTPPTPPTTTPSHAYELYNMHLNADLAVLSACNTGAGKLISGEGIMSLSRAFKYAGCPNILMSLWSVNDASAKDIIVDFHRKLKAGSGKSDALQIAQKSYLEQADETFTHPFYWATFVMVGNNEAMSIPSHWARWVVGIGILLAAGIAFWNMNYWKGSVVSS